MVKKADKRGVSIMIGYVLLVTAAIVMSFIVYSWMKTYIPKEELKCPDDVSLTIGEVQCNDEKMLVTIKNNGLFNIDGYTIKGDIYQGGVGFGKTDLYEKGYFYFDEPGKPEKEKQNNIPFGIDSSVSGSGLFIVKEIEITPVIAKFNTETGKNETTICSDAIAKKNIEILNCVVRLKP